MAATEPMIREQDLKFNIWRSAFCDEPHDIFVVYDERMDDLIVRLVPEDVLVSAYHVTDDMALLVDMNSLEVVGFQIAEYVSEFLEKQGKQSRKFITRALATGGFRRYQRIKYAPPETMERVEEDIISMLSAVGRGGMQTATA